jgi:hypothetical protein
MIAKNSSHSEALKLAAEFLTFEKGTENVTQNLNVRNQQSTPTTCNI